MWNSSLPYAPSANRCLPQEQDSDRYRDDFAAKVSGCSTGRACEITSGRFVEAKQEE